MYDSQLRWLGPEKGVMHMAIGAVVNALWDLKAKRAGQPLWQLLAAMTPEELVGLVDFRYLTDALTPEEALEILRDAVPGRAERTAQLLEHGYPAYTTTPGWLGYSDEKLVRLAREAVAEGFAQIKLKVGGDLDDDIRRLAIARERSARTSRSRSTPTSAGTSRTPSPGWRARRTTWPGSRSPPAPTTCSATPPSHGASPGAGRDRRARANRVMFKQLLQAGAIDVMQIDAARVAGVNENLANLLLAAKFGVPVCPHAGGVGLCEAVQHLSMFDFVAVSGTMDDRMIEYVDHLHEHFVTPTVVSRGRYLAPTAPGAGTEMLADSVDAYTWRGATPGDRVNAAPSAP